jgi:hypothetical protein
MLPQSKLLISFVTAGLLLGSGGAFSADPVAEPALGRQLMTEQERVEHRTAMRSARFSSASNANIRVKSWKSNSNTKISAGFTK